MTSIVVDTSAVMAIVRAEPGAEWLSRQLRDSDHRLMSSATGLELGIVLESRTTTLTALDAIRSLQIELAPFDEEQFELGLRAWRTYGRGRHPASLNYGDCFTYALAKITGHAILCVGADFARADLPVLTPPQT
ncbi:MAG: type II toxin-antitoxin system VapC family toxin [Phycicoccus sp.]|nr:type II toxin-antitoxin system VapC family toxin [Phycicoccus sp.]